MAETPSVTGFPTVRVDGYVAPGRDGKPADHLAQVETQLWLWVDARGEGHLALARQRDYTWTRAAETEPWTELVFVPHRPGEVEGTLAFPLAYPVRAPGDTATLVGFGNG